MNRFFLNTLFFFSLLLLGVCRAPTVEGHSVYLAVNGESIRIRAEHEPLKDVLQAIHEKSGVRFSFPPSLADTPVSAELQTSSWQMLVKYLLRGFSKVEFWAEEASLSRVKILGIGDYQPGEAPRVQSPPVTQKAALAPQPSAETLANQAKRWVNSDKMVEDPDHPLAKLPAHVFLEPGVLSFLMQNKVEIPDFIKRKYGLDRQGAALPRALPIPPHIRQDPALKAYLETTGLTLPDPLLSTSESKR